MSGSRKLGRSPNGRPPRCGFGARCLPHGVVLPVIIVSGSMGSANKRLISEHETLDGRFSTTRFRELRYSPCFANVDG
jgi:hypothetical protein